MKWMWVNKGEISLFQCKCIQRNKKKKQMNHNWGLNIQLNNLWSWSIKIMAMIIKEKEVMKM